MKMLKPFLGLACALGFAYAALAQTTLRPVSRDDGTSVKASAEIAAFAAFGAAVQPSYRLGGPIEVETRVPLVRPKARAVFHPATRWEHKDGHSIWTRAAMTAVASHGDGLHALVPKDIAAWCPAYEDNTPQQRRAFWVGMMSALSKHESTYNPRAVGGGDLWYGLLQIYPPTARGYGCRAQTGDALKDPTENLSCAARIMNVTVLRDNAIAVHDGRWRGVAADWGPMSNRSKIAEMSAWTSRQSYCQALDAVRPRARP